MFKVEVLNPSSNSNNKNVKKSICGCKQSYYNHKSSFAHEIYRHKISLSNYICEVKTKFGIDPILKWEIVKTCSKYKAGNRYCKLCVEIKLTIATYDKLKELLKQRSEIFDICKHKKNWLISG